MFLNIGLFIIIVAWILQLMSKSNKIQPHFIFTYIVGVGFLIVDAYQVNLLNMAILNLVSAVVAFCVYFQIKK